MNWWFVSGSDRNEWSPLFSTPDAAQAHAYRLGYTGNFAILMVEGSPADARAMAAQRHAERLAGQYSYTVSDRV